MVDIKSLKNAVEMKIRDCGRVVIIPHDFTDFDAIGSALGISLIAKKYKKPYSIIVNDPPHVIEPGVKKIINECSGEYEIIKKNQLMRSNYPNELFILTDVNKSNLICVNDCLPDKENIIIIDHHGIGEKTVPANYTFISEHSSSASEIVTELLKSMKITIPSDVATYLYAGIRLDTNNFGKNINDTTMHRAGDLVQSGANVEKVNEYFQEDIESYKRVHDLVINNIHITNFMIALITADEDIIYAKDELAKAANKALEFGASASFSIGRISDNTIAISARSVCDINIKKIMELLGGGGYKGSGGTTINDSTIDEVSKKLVKILTPPYFGEDETKDIK